MHAIAANSRCCIDDRNNLTAGLQKLIAYNKTDISGAEHQYLIARLDVMQVHHRLSRSRSDHSRCRPAAEWNHIFACSGCSQNAVSLIMMDLLSDFDGDFLFRVKPHDSCV